MLSGQKRFSKTVLVCFLCLSCIGCATLRKKFIRKKKMEDKRSPIIVGYDDQELLEKEADIEGVYKHRYFFWKTWHLELTNRLDMNYKKRSLCFDNTLKKLSDVKASLNEAKSTELEQSITKLKALETAIKKPRRLSTTEFHRTKRRLEQIRRHIEGRFSYLDVKDSLIEP